MKPASLTLLVAFLLAPTCALASGDKAGDEYRITLVHKSESKRDDGSSSSSSSGGHEYFERVLDVRSNGVERLYDIPLEPDDETRLINWQFPVRVFEADDGGVQILNREELEQRRDAWLEAAGISAEACGSWYFTWNAFQVECDPDAIIETIRAIKVHPKGLSEGASFYHPAASQPGLLKSLERDGSRSVYVAHMPVDPEYFHRAAAEADVIVGEMMREPISFEEAYASRMTEPLTGTIEVVLEAKSDGRVWKRVTSIETVQAQEDGGIERSVSTETVEREPLDESRS